MMWNKVTVKYLFLKLVFILTMYGQGVILQHWKKTFKKNFVAPFFMDGVQLPQV